MATATSQHTLTVTSPYDRRPLGELPVTDAEGTRDAISTAHAALAKPLPAHERAAILDRAAALVSERAEKLARSISDEAGKPITAARAEVARAQSTLLFSAAAARTLRGETIAMDASPKGVGKLAFTQLKPLGVVAAITPFNFPLNLCCHKIGPAIAAGCPIVHKPADKTPLTAVELHRILLDAGLSAERYQLIVGDAATIGDTLIADPRVRLLTFTGSGRVGWSLAARAPKKRVTLELGNSTPLIVRADADLEAAADIIAASGYGFAGQTCISVQRVLVAREAADTLLDLVLSRVTALKCGDPAGESVVVGPVITEQAAQGIAQKLSDARAGGAVLECGGGVDGTMVEPFVLTGVEPTMDVFAGELFGPGITINEFASDDEAIELANATDYGLQAGVLTRDVTAALNIAERLSFAGITINESPTWRTDQMPYGGVNDSGNTREGPAYAVRSMSESQLIIVQR